MSSATKDDAAADEEGCLGDELLIAFAEGEVSDAERDRALAHSDTCPACRALLVGLGQVSPIGASTVEPGAAASAPPVARGVSIGRYLVTDLLGVGAMGEVHAAYDPDLDRKVAIKLLRPDHQGDRLVERLVREAKVMARLSHDNVIPVFDVGTYGDRFFVAMAHVQGQTLEQWLRSARRSWREVLAHFIAAGRGLVAAHAVKIIHRDFKPDNVLVGDDDRVRVADFGLATSGEGEAVGADRGTDTSQLPAGSGTEVGTMIGTPAYMAPEVLARTAATEASDQFSFCVALYRGLYGERPFAGDTIGELSQSISAELVRPAPRDARVPAWLRRVMMRGLRFRPEDRYPSMAELLRALARDPNRRWRMLALAATALVVIGVLAVGGRGDDPRARCDRAASELGAVWSAPRAASVRAALVAGGAPHAPSIADAVDRIIQSWAGRWVAARTESCEATYGRGTQSTELFDRRVQCLGRQLRQLDELASVLAQPSPRLVDAAVKAAEALPPADLCSGASLLASHIAPPPDVATGARAEALRIAIDKTTALVRAARYDEAQVATDRIVADARQLAYLPVEAEALWLLGRLEEQRRQLAEAAVSMQQAFRFAVAAGDERTAADALARASFVTGVLLERRDEGVELARVADALAVRVGDQRIALMIEYTNGIFAFEGGELDVARARFEHVLEARRKLYGGDHSDIAHSLNTVGRVYRALGDFETARRAYADSIAMRERLVGSEHPDIAVEVNNLGLIVFEDLADYDAARPLFERALRLKQRRRPDSADVGSSYTNLANVMALQGDYAGALDMARHGVELMVREWGDNHGLTAHGYRVLGDIMWAFGRGEDALTYYRRSVEGRRATKSQEDLLEILLLHARSQAATGHLAGAEASLAEADAVKAGELDPRRQRLAASLLCQVRLLTGSVAVALARCEEARAAVDAAANPNTPERVAARLYGGVALLQATRSSGATTLLEEALELITPRRGDVVLRAETRLALAGALQGRDPDRAAALTRDAKDQLVVALGQGAPRVAQIGARP